MFCTVTYNRVHSRFRGVIFHQALLLQPARDVVPGLAPTLLAINRGSIFGAAVLAHPVPPAGRHLGDIDCIATIRGVKEYLWDPESAGEMTPLPLGGALHRTLLDWTQLAHLWVIEKDSSRVLEFLERMQMSQGA